ncbi:MAG: YfiR family protein [Nitrospirae bacterium]|nr:YfiR family protein [Nitrospirota bacterium]
MMRPGIRRLALLLICCLTAAAFPAFGQQVAPGEYQVKAAFLCNFAKFVEWPSELSSEADHLDICILGDDPFGAAFEQIQARGVSGRKPVVRRLKSTEHFRGCHILFISSSEERRIGRVVEALKGLNILTVGDTQGFAERGISINFILEEKKVRFEINIEAARRSGLKISSRLLKLAATVYGQQ